MLCLRMYAEPCAIAVRVLLEPLSHPILFAVLRPVLPLPHVLIPQCGANAAGNSLTAAFGGGYPASLFYLPTL